MTEFKFTPGEYLTRDGRKAVVLCDDGPGRYCLIGYLIDPSHSDGGVTCSWKPCGKNYTTLGRDLMPPVTEPEQVVRWVNLYEDGKVEVSDDRWEMESAGVVAISRVVLTPGLFEDENTPDPYTRGWNEALEAAAVAVDKDDRPYFAQAARIAYKVGKDTIRALKRSAP